MPIESKGINNNNICNNLFIIIKWLKRIVVIKQIRNENFII